MLSASRASILHSKPSHRPLRPAAGAYSTYSGQGSASRAVQPSSAQKADLGFVMLSSYRTAPIYSPSTRGRCGVAEFVADPGFLSFRVATPYEIRMSMPSLLATPGRELVSQERKEHRKGPNPAGTTLGDLFCLLLASPLSSAGQHPVLCSADVIDAFNLAWRSDLASSLMSTWIQTFLAWLACLLRQWAAKLHSLASVPDAATGSLALSCI